MRKTSTFVLAVVLGAALLLAGCGKSAKDAGGTAAGRDMRVVIVSIPDVPEAAYAFKTGEVVRVKDTGVTIGTIDSIEITPTMEAVAQPDGHLVVSPSPFTKEVRLVLSGRAEQRNGAYFFTGGQLWVTPEDEFITQTVQFKGAVVSIEPKAK